MLAFIQQIEIMFEYIELLIAHAKHTKKKQQTERKIWQKDGKNSEIHFIEWSLDSFFIVCCMLY
jgi:hypothetical protein